MRQDNRIIFASIHSAISPSIRKGIVAVEFAILCPMILLVALAGADFARVSHFRQVVINAARAGAERGACQKFTEFTRPFWEEKVRQASLNEMQNVSGFDPDKFEYELTTSTDADGMTHISVDVAYLFEAAVAWPGLPTNITLQKQLVFRQFR